MMSKTDLKFVIEITEQICVFTVPSHRPEGLTAKEATLVLMTLTTSGILTEFRRMELLRYIKAVLQTGVNLEK